MGRFTDWLFMRDDGEQTEGQTAEEGRAADESSVSDPLLSALVKSETITREAAMTLPAVSGAVDFISNTIASMPVRLYKRKQGTVEEQDKDTRVKLLNGDTGDTLDAFQLKKAMVEDYLLDGNGYCYIER
jgi:phage portal protein BeeE